MNVALVQANLAEVAKHDEGSQAHMVCVLVQERRPTRRSPVLPGSWTQLMTVAMLDQLVHDAQ